jgi:ABC-type branched-subunit amino acid transport system ATPase component
MHGIAQVPKGRQAFAPLAIHDNLRLGVIIDQYQRHRSLTARRGTRACGLSRGFDFDCNELQGSAGLSRRF